MAAELEAAAMTSAGRRWARLSREWARSGQTQGEFCRRRGIEVGTFRWWRWHLKLVRDLEVDVAAEFIPAHIVDSPAVAGAGALTAGLIEVVCRSGHAVRLSGEVDVDVVARLVERLERLS